MRWCIVQTNEYDLQAKTYPNICTHHKLHNKNENKFFNKDQGAVSIRKTVLPGMAIPMLKIRRPNGRLIFNMEIAIRR